MSLQEYHSHSANMKCHNLCTSTPPPNNMAKLLGLGSKFCLQTKKLNKEDFKQMINRLKYDVRVKYFVKNVLRTNQEHMPKIYMKTNNQNIPNAPPTIEGALKRFEKALMNSFKLRQNNNNTNLTKLQENVLHYFRMHDELVILRRQKSRPLRNEQGRTHLTMHKTAFVRCQHIWEN